MRRGGGDSGYLAGRAPAPWVGEGEGTLVSPRDRGSPAPTHGISNGCQKPILFNLCSSQKMPMKAFQGLKVNRTSKGLPGIVWSMLDGICILREIPG